MKCQLLNYNQPKSESNTPAATAEPITPATFGPMANIKDFPDFEQIY
jgi:hypothetical protein